MRAALFIAAVALGLGPGIASADTLYLRAGTTLKVESLSCRASSCLAILKGGEVEVRAVDVLRVEPDEEFDPEPVRSVSAPGSDVDSRSRTVEQMVADAARKYGLPPSLVRAVALAESGLDPSAISPKGALGVMQLMPGTARELGVRNGLDVAENIDAGARLLRQLLETYEGRVAEALAAYNAGAGAVAKHGGVPPYRETRGYIRRVVKDFETAEKRDVASSSGEKKP